MRRWLWFPALLAIAYLALCALLYFKQRSLIYFPQATRPALATDFVLPTASGAMRGWVINPGHRHAAVYFGGNAETVEDNRPEFQQFLPDRTVYLLPYRGYGGNPGQPSQTALVEDAVALFDAVRKQHRNGDIAVIGRSLGSGVASQLAALRPVHRLVLVTPFDSLSNVAATHYPWLPVRWLLRDRYDSVSALSRYQGRLLILRAGRDAVVPPRRTDGLIASLNATPVVVNFPDAGHDDLSASPRYWQAMAQFLTASE